MGTEIIAGTLSFVDFVFNQQFHADETNDGSGEQAVEQPVSEAIGRKPRIVGRGQCQQGAEHQRAQEYLDLHSSLQNVKRASLPATLAGHFRKCIHNHIICTHKSNDMTSASRRATKSRRLEKQGSMLEKTISFTG
jgi:hypothetical protein